MAIKNDNLGGTDWVNGNIITEDTINPTNDIMALTAKKIAYAENGDSVFSGCVITEQGTPDQTVQMSSGEILVGGLYYSVDANSSISLSVADGTNPRYDIISLDSAGTVSVTDGTAAASPTMPTKPVDNVVVSYIYRAANDNVIGTADITDCRAIIGQKYLEIDNSKDENKSTSYGTYKTITIPAFKLRKNCVVTFDYCSYIETNPDNIFGDSDVYYGVKVLVDGVSALEKTPLIRSSNSGIDEEYIMSESGTGSFVLDLDNYDNNQILVLTLQLKGAKVGSDTDKECYGVNNDFKVEEN